jgi:hypothetical protein
MSELYPPFDPEEAVRDLPELVPAKRAAKFLNLTTRTLRNYRRNGRLGTMKSSPGKSGRVLIPKAEMRRLLVQMTGNGRKPPPPRAAEAATLTSECTPGTDERVTR